MSDTEMAGWQANIHNIVRPRREQTAVGTISRTKTSEQEAADINAIMRKYQSTGQFPEQRTPGAYGNFASGMDYHAALNQIQEAEAAFNELPSSVRSHVSNDPGQLLDLVHNPERIEEARTLGLLPPANEPDPEPAPAAPEPSPAPPVTPT